jgi:hypothetical protein
VCDVIKQTTIQQQKLLSKMVLKLLFVLLLVVSTINNIHALDNNQLLMNKLRSRIVEKNKMEHGFQQVCEKTCDPTLSNLIPSGTYKDTCTSCCMLDRSTLQCQCPGGIIPCIDISYCASGTFDANFQCVSSSG